MMANHQSVDFLRELNLLDWPTLSLGWKRRWANRSSIVDFAVAWLIEHPDEEDLRILEIASCEGLEDAELSNLLSGWVEVGVALEDAPNSREMDKWRLAKLWILATGDLDPETKLDQLERIYADFGYPEDMARCSRYFVAPSQERRGWELGDQSESPLDAMTHLLADLSAKLGVEAKLAASISLDERR